MMNRLLVNYCVIGALVLFSTVSSYSQNAVPEELREGTITEQLNYLEEHTRIYENFRAIREDMFRTIKKNTIDTLVNARKTIIGLNLKTSELNNRIDSLNKNLEATNKSLDDVTRTKESISVLGLNVNKVTYNSIMWTILAIMVFLLIIGYLTFKQNRSVTIRTKKDLAELKDEFEEYKKRSRLEREKMNMDHFNEIKKLKAGGSR